MYNKALNIGLTIDEFHELEWSKFIELSEISRRQEMYKLKNIRLHASLVSGKDLRHVFPLEGDFEYLEVSTPELTKNISAKLGASKFFAKLDNKKPN